MLHVTWSRDHVITWSRMFSFCHRFVDSFYQRKIFECWHGPVVNELSAVFCYIRPGTSTNTKYQISGIKWQVSGVLAWRGVTSSWAVALVWRWELRTENWELRTRDKPLDSIASGIGHHLDCVSCVAYQEIYLDIGVRSAAALFL